MKLEWKQIYSVDSEELDEDHKQIFVYINKIEENIYNRNSEFFNKILQDLKNYATVHFSKEENYMKSMGFPDVVEHILEHKLFTKKILELEDKSKDFVLLNNTIDFIKDWIIAHILGSDKEYQKFKHDSESK